MLSQLIRDQMNRGTSYIIGLKEPGHCKESLSGLCGSKMLSLCEQRYENERR